MKLIKTLDKIVENRGLKIWDKRVFPELKNEIIITNFCRPILVIFNYESDSFEKITITENNLKYINHNEINLPIQIKLNSDYIILGNSEILYYTEYIIGSHYQIIKREIEIDSFLNRIFDDIVFKIDNIKINLENWKDCWLKFYDILINYSNQYDIETRFNLELFNLSFNSDYSNYKNLSCVLKNIYNQSNYYNLSFCTDPFFLNISYKNDRNQKVDYFIHDSRDKEYNKYQNSPSRLLHVLENEINNYKVVESLCFY